jgi:hypothetical protein
MDSKSCTWKRTWGFLSEKCDQELNMTKTCDLTGKMGSMLGKWDLTRKSVDEP